MISQSPMKNSKMKFLAQIMETGDGGRERRAKRHPTGLRTALVQLSLTSRGSFDIRSREEKMGIHSEP